MTQTDDGKKLQVWYGSMPESNGKANWTAILHRGDVFEVSHTFARSEYKDRVRYEADCVRYLIGEIDKKPYILDYDGNLIEHANDEEYAKWERAIAEHRPKLRMLTAEEVAQATGSKFPKVSPLRVQEEAEVIAAFCRIHGLPFAGV